MLSAYGEISKLVTEELHRGVASICLPLRIPFTLLENNDLSKIVLVDVANDILGAVFIAPLFMAEFWLSTLLLDFSSKLRKEKRVYIHHMSRIEYN